LQRCGDQVEQANLAAGEQRRVRVVDLPLGEVRLAQQRCQRHAFPARMNAGEARGTAGMRQISEPGRAAANKPWHSSVVLARSANKVACGDICGRSALDISAAGRLIHGYRGRKIMSEESQVIAIVDDDASILQAFGRLFTASGYRVQLFNTAYAFLATPEASNAACVILDIDLGAGESGFDLARKLTAATHTPPVIFITGRIKPEMRIRAEEIGCVAFLEKPIPAELLLATVRSAVGGR
jgi:CheY-like chemotaxis protein